ncbi:putative protein kinase [Leishmania infantum JPCM5]|uniref:Uncharacterized protein n=2 Tax=Leishmania infantum TaxID=5671 RepID=A4HY58_LEIIN|nr:putative protein kinase [Leishmania infantum JPCM5]CAC9482504.1 protein_kinase_-_putative [Leishmania infantum]CAM67241.1 putative protein kinase [Leishmania infantum JPCM5]SUZ41133.1 protein_kinase_-_putative [Leishmania infantum]|eukprot:XP_001464999.1 putative protein kinase [Leishmania infantum JPCM5]
MPSSNLVTDAYHNTELAINVFFSIHTDANPVMGRKATKASVVPIAASLLPANAAVMIDDDLTPGVADFGATTEPAVRSPSSVEREVFENSIADIGGGGALSQSVVSRRDMSLADISRMRLEGCRARHTLFAATTSLRGSMASSLRSTSGSPMLPLTGRVRDHAGICGETTSAAISAVSQAPAWSSLNGLGRSFNRRSSMLSVRTNALDTSIAILQHMAHDTAARAEAACNAQSLAGTPSTATSACGSVALPSLQPTQPYPEDTHAGARGYKVVGSGNTASVEDSCSGSGQHTPVLHTVHTRQFTSASDSSSPLNSLSESELCSGHLRAGGRSHLSAQASATHLTGSGGVAKAASDLQHSSPRSHPDGSPLAARRQTIATADHRAPHHSVAVAATEVALPSAQNQTTDVSVYNHDFQHIVPLEVKEALQRNMRPICEDDDDDDDDALLHDGLSAPTPPPLTSFANVTHSMYEDTCHLDTPSNYVRTRGTGSVGGAGTEIADAPFSFPPSTLHAPSRLFASPNAPALQTATSSMIAWQTGGTGGAKSIRPFDSDTAETLAAGLSISGTGVPFQAWKFPSLGKPNSASSLRKTSLGENGNAEALPEGAVGGAAAVHQPTVPLSEHCSHPTRETLMPGSPQRQCSESPPLTRNGLQATSKHITLKTAATPCSSVAVGALSGSGDVGPRAASLLSGVDGTHRTSSVVHGTPMRTNDGAGGRFVQPAVAQGSPSSAAGSLSAAADSSNTRKLEMMYTVYERLLHARPPDNSFPEATPRSLQTLTSRSLTEEVTPPLDTSPSPPAAQQAPQSGAAGAGFEAMSQGDCSPSMSYSGALSRSAGYYSFGKRISLSHPNKQTLPHQFLGSAANLHAMSSPPRVAMIGTPAVADMIVASNGNSSGSAMAFSSTARARRRTLDLSVLQRIDSRPLLQSTLFLQNNLHSICEAQARFARKERAEDAGSAEQRNAISLSPSKAAVSVAVKPVPQYTVPLEEQSAAGVPSPASVADVETCEGVEGVSQGRMTGRTAIAETASPVVLGSAAASATAASTARELNQTRSSCRGTQVPSVDSVLPSSVSPSIGKRSNASSLPVNCIQEGQGRQEEPLRKQAEMHVNPTAAAAVSVAHESNGISPHRYYRALTEAKCLVRHVHGVDGVEREVDNDSMDLVVYAGMHLMGWLEVVSLLGCGSFGQVFLCKDLRICDGHFVHPSEIEGEDYEYWNCSHAYLPFSSVDAVPTHRPLVAVKVVKSVPLLEQQSVLEAEMLVLIGAQTALPPANAAEEARESAIPAFAAATGGRIGVNEPPPADPRCANIAKVLADGICYGHHCIVMERYGANLYEYIAANDHRGLPMYQIRSIGAQLFSALSLVHEECHIIHADIKPENVLLTLDSGRGTLRVTDEPSPITAATAAATPPAEAMSNSNASTTAVATKTPRSVPQQNAFAEAAHRSPSSTSPNAEPPWHQQRTESAASSSASPSLPAERSHTARVGPGAVARQRLGFKGKRRNSNTLLDLSSSPMTLATYKGHSLCHLRSSSASRATIVEQTDMPTPEPRRMHMLSQSSALVTSAASGMSLQSLGGGGAGSYSRHMMQAPAAPVEEAPAVPVAPAASHLHVRLIDFSSSCYDGGPFYQYIQSRYYRAPEVIIGAPYNSAIDVWSTGCLLAELLLGMPLLPGCNDHHQLSLVEEMIEPLPDYLVEDGDNADLFYIVAAPGGEGSTDAALPRAPAAAAPGATASATLQQPRSFALRTRENYLEVTGSEPLQYRRYFTYQTLQELVRHCPLTLEERRMSNGLHPYVSANESSAIPPDATPSLSVRSDMMKQRYLLFDLLRRLLQTDSKLRPTAAQALQHPFFSSLPPYFKTFALD